MPDKVYVVFEVYSNGSKSIANDLFFYSRFAAEALRDQMALNAPGVDFSIRTLSVGN